MKRLRRLAGASVIAFAVFVGPKPASAQLVVFDPNNYAQNVLTAARACSRSTTRSYLCKIKRRC